MQLYTINESFHLLIDHELIFTLALEYPFVFNSFFRRNIFFLFFCILMERFIVEKQGQVNKGRNYYLSF